MWEDPACLPGFHNLPRRPLLLKDPRGLTISVFCSPHGGNTTLRMDDRIMDNNPPTLYSQPIEAFSPELQLVVSTADAARQVFYEQERALSDAAARQSNYVETVIAEVTSSGNAVVMPGQEEPVTRRPAAGLLDFANRTDY